MKTRLQSSKGALAAVVAFVLVLSACGSDSKSSSSESAADKRAAQVDCNDVAGTIQEAQSRLADNEKKDGGAARQATATAKEDIVALTSRKAECDNPTTTAASVSTDASTVVTDVSATDATSVDSVVTTDAASVPTDAATTAVTEAPTTAAPAAETTAAPASTDAPTVQTVKVWPEVDGQVTPLVYTEGAPELGQIRNLGVVETPADQWASDPGQAAVARVVAEPLVAYELAQRLGGDAGDTAGVNGLAGLYDGTTWTEAGKVFLIQLVTQMNAQWMGVADNFGTATNVVVTMANAQRDAVDLNREAKNLATGSMAAWKTPCGQVLMDAKGNLYAPCGCEKAPVHTTKPPPKTPPPTTVPPPVPTTPTTTPSTPPTTPTTPPPTPPTTVPPPDTSCGTKCHPGVTVAPPPVTAAPPSTVAPSGPTTSIGDSGAGAPDPATTVAPTPTVAPPGSIPSTSVVAPPGSHVTVP